MNVVEMYWLAMAWSFGQAYISGNYRFKNLSPKEASQIRRHLSGQRGPFIIHCENDTFDCKFRVQRPSDSHQRVKKLRHSLKSKVFALDGNEYGIGRCQGI